MTVQKYALHQIHVALRKDPWVQAVLLAAGLSLDSLADRIVAIYNADDFDNINADQAAVYEKLLGLITDEERPLVDRRAAIRAAWNAARKPTLATIQAVCDAWEEGGVVVGYKPGTLVLQFIGEYGVPSNLEALMVTLRKTIPAHLDMEHHYRYLLIKEVHETMTLAQLEDMKLGAFAGGA